MFPARGRASCLHIYFPLWFLISSTHNCVILAKPFVVRSVIIFRLSFPSLGWLRRWADRLLPFCRRYKHPGGRDARDGFLCHNNFIRPKAAPTLLRHASVSSAAAKFQGGPSTELYEMHPPLVSGFVLILTFISSASRKGFQKHLQLRSEQAGPAPKCCMVLLLPCHWSVEIPPIPFLESRWKHWVRLR